MQLRVAVRGPLFICCAPRVSANKGVAAEHACASALIFFWVTIRVKGVPNTPDAPARTRPLRPQVELPAGNDLRERCVEMGEGPHANVPAGAIGGVPCGGTVHLRGVPDGIVETHANAPIGAVSGDPYEVRA